MTNPIAIVQRQLDAYNAKDLPAFLACYSQNAACFDHPSTLLTEGRAALEVRYAARFRDPLLHARLVNRIAVGSTVIDHEDVTRTFPDGPGRVDVIAIYDVVGAEIRRVWFKTGTPVLDPP